MADDPFDRLIVRDGKAVVPDGAKKSGNNITYNGKIYDATTGVLIGTAKDGVDEKKRKEAADRIKGVADDPLGTGVEAVVGGFNPLQAFGVSKEDFDAVALRTGIILLGATLGIIGVAFIVSGTKAASVAVSAIPVAGKVLS